MLLKLTTVEEDRESLEQVEGLLRPLQMELTSTMASINKKYVYLFNYETN